MSHKSKHTYGGMDVRHIHTCTRHQCTLTLCLSISSFFLFVLNSHLFPCTCLVRLDFFHSCFSYTCLRYHSVFIVIIPPVIMLVIVLCLLPFMQNKCMHKRQDCNVESDASSEQTHATARAGISSSSALGSVAHSDTKSKTQLCQNCMQTSRRLIRCKFGTNTCHDSRGNFIERGARERRTL